MDTPCIQVCTLSECGTWCTGCFRSKAEITAWTRLRPAERRRIMAELPARRAGGTNGSGFVQGSWSP
jgi:predicted Fe-S protein YdhL (DUF1289 family)